MGRWIGLVRPLMPFTAGASGMPYRRFLPYDVLGAGGGARRSACSATSSGAASSRSRASPGAGRSRSPSLLALFVGGYQAFKRLRDPSSAAVRAWVDRQAQKPLLRPLAWIGARLWLVLRRSGATSCGPLWPLIAPPLRFLIARLTPGGLGIELTTLLAIVAVGVYSSCFRSTCPDRLAAPGDNTALDIARDIESGC